MPAASIVTTYLNPPFNRKVGFHNAFKQAMENAGFPATNIDEYDIADTGLVNGQGGVAFNAGQAGSVQGFVKELTYNASTNGILGFGGFTRTVYSFSLGGSGMNSASYVDSAFMAGCFVYAGGWNSSTKSPVSASSGKAIGGYSYNSAFSASLAMTDIFSRDGSFGFDGHPFNAVSAPSQKVSCILNFTNPIKFTAINHPEIRGVYIQQMNKVPYFLGICKPSNPPNWLNENVYPYAFISQDSSFFNYKTFHGVSHPYNTAYNNWVIISSAGIGHWVAQSTGNYSVSQGMGFGNSNEKLVNPLNVGNSNKRDIISRPYLFNTSSGSGIDSGKWLYGQYSDDIVVTLSHGLQLFDKIIISPGTEEYMVITTPEFTNLSNSSAPMSTLLVGNASTFNYYSMAIRTI